MTAPDRLAQTLIKNPCQTGASTYDNAEEGTMPDPSSPEAIAIEVAYEDQVKALFKVLVANLVEEPVSHEADRQQRTRCSSAGV
jgi:hypothetical protein